jgi:hypothetical protein
LFVGIFLSLELVVRLGLVLVKLVLVGLVLGLVRLVLGLVRLKLGLVLVRLVLGLVLGLGLVPLIPYKLLLELFLLFLHLLLFL